MNSMLEKTMHKSGNMLQKGIQMGAKIDKILIKRQVRKYVDFWFTRGGRGRQPRDPRGGFGGVPFSMFQHTDSKTLTVTDRWQ